MKIILSKNEIETALKDYIKKTYALDADSVSVVKKSKLIQKGLCGTINKTEISAIVNIK